MKKLWIKAGLLLSFHWFIQLACAANIPSDLAVWEDWVKYDQGYRDCPYFSNQKAANKSQHVCAWPQSLDIKISSTIASFSVTWEVLDDSWIPLPGDHGSWPQQVKVNQNSAVVQNQNNQPRIWLTPGIHQITGEFI